MIFQVSMEPTFSRNRVSCKYRLFWIFVGFSTFSHSFFFSTSFPSLSFLSFFLPYHYTSFILLGRAPSLILVLSPSLPTLIPSVVRTPRTKFHLLSQGHNSLYYTEFYLNFVILCLVAVTLFSECKGWRRAFSYVLMLSLLSHALSKAMKYQSNVFNLVYVSSIFNFCVEHE